MDDIKLDIELSLNDLDGEPGGYDNPFIDGTDVQLIVESLTEDSLNIALAILDRAQTKVPVDTGFLKSTGRVEQVDNGYKVVYDAPYASYVESIDYYKHETGQAHFLEDAYNEIMNSDLVIGGGGDLD